MPSPSPLLPDSRRPQGPAPSALPWRQGGPWPAWSRLWEPGRSYLVEARSLWTEEWSLAELLAQDPGFGFEGQVSSAPDFAHPLREVLRRRGFWGGPGRRAVQRMVALAANLARESGGGLVHVRLMRVEGPRPDLLVVPEGRLRLLRYYLAGGLPLLPEQELKPGGILLLRPGAPLVANPRGGRNLVLCLETDLRAGA